MSDPKIDPNGPYDPQPRPAPVPDAAPVAPGHTPLEIPPVPASEPPGIPATDPDRSPGPAAPPEPSGPTA